jgi:hypothetical protein
MAKLAYNKAENEQVLKALVDMGEEMSAAELAELMGLELYRVRDRLNSLLKGGRVVRKSHPLHPGQPGWQYKWTVAPAPEVVEYTEYKDEPITRNGSKPKPQPLMPVALNPNNEALILLTMAILEAHPVSPSPDTVRLVANTMVQAHAILAAVNRR